MGDGEGRQSDERAPWRESERPEGEERSAHRDRPGQARDDEPTGERPHSQPGAGWPEPQRPSEPEEQSPAPSDPEQQRPAPPEPEQQRLAPPEPEQQRPAATEPEPQRPAPTEPEQQRPAPTEPEPQRPSEPEQQRPAPTDPEQQRPVRTDPEGSRPAARPSEDAGPGEDVGPGPAYDRPLERPATDHRDPPSRGGPSRVPGDLVEAARSIDPAAEHLPDPTAHPSTTLYDLEARRGAQPTAPPEAYRPRPPGPSVRRPAQIIALANQKGGVGKTTSVINLGAALAELGNRVLLIDMDPQGSVGVGMGSEPHRMDRTIYNLLMADGTSPDEVIIQTAFRDLHVLPSNIDLAAAEVMLVQEVAREQSLRRVLDRLRYRYDFMLIDCPPSLGLLTINGLTAADSVIIPLECEYFALRGMTLLMNTISKVQERLNPELEIKGILATMVDTRTIHAREVLERVHEAFGDIVFKTTINKTIRFAEAPVAGEPILTYAAENRGAEAYRELGREVLSREPTS